MLAELKKAGKEYKVGDQTIVALQPTDFTMREGELTLIIGPSGSGKTTLLSLLGCVIYPSYGDLWVDGQHINALKENQLARLRLETIGFVFQNFNLLMPLSAEENVAMPLKLMNVKSAEIKRRVKEALEVVDMTDRRKNMQQNSAGCPAGGTAQRPPSISSDGASSDCDRR